MDTPQPLQSGSVSETPDTSTSVPDSTRAGPMRPIPTLVTFTVLAALAWLVVGAVGYNAASGLGPRVTEDAQILSIDSDFNAAGSGADRTTRWVEGTTESGRTWRFASDDIYDVATSEGYPMDVEVTISTWTGSTIAVRGDSFDEDRSGRVAGLMWALLTVVVLLGVLGCAWLIRRKESMLAFVTFMVTAPLWLWLGFLVMRAVRT